MLRLTPRRLLLICACLLIAALIVGPLTLAWAVLYTESGVQFAVRHLPRRLGPVTLEIAGLSGTPARGLHVERVEVDHELVHLKFEHIDGQVALMPLLLQTIRVTHGTVQDAQVTVKQRTHPATPGPPSFLPRWLLISAEDAHVGRAALSVYNGFRMEVTDISGAAVVRHLSIRLFQASGVWAGAHLSALGELLATDPLGLRVQGHLDWHPAGQPPYVLDGSAQGDLNALHVNARTASPLRADVTGSLLDLTNHLHWVASTQLHELDLASFGVGSSPFGIITGELSGTGDTEHFRASGTLTPQGLRAGAFAVLFDGGFASRTLSAQRLEARSLESGARATGSGSIAFTDPGPRLSVRGSWEQLRWPLGGRDVAFRSAGGSFALEGVMPYRVHVSGDAHVLDLPVMPADVYGTLGKDGVSFERADVDVYGGHTTASGRLTWSPSPSYEVSGHATGIDPARLRPDLPGSLTFDYSVSGRGFDPKGSLNIAFSGLSGKLRGAWASGSGALAHAGSTWTFSNLRVALGSTTLALDGQIDQRLNLRFALAAQDLSLLSPASKGHIRAAGTLGGTFTDPQFTGNAHAADVEYQGIKLKALDADIDFEPDAAGKDSRADVRLHGLTYGNRTLDAASLTLSGPPGAYLVHLTATAPGIDATAQARGAYAHGTYRGQLTGLSFSGNQALHLTLERAVDLEAALTHVRIDWLCLTGTPGSVCADGEWSPHMWATTVMTNELPLTTLTAGMTPSVQYLGTINALARLGAGPDEPIMGTVRVDLANAEIAHRLASRKIDHTRIGSGDVEVALGPQQIQGRASLGDGQVGTMRASVDVTRSTPSWTDMPVKGEFHAQSADMDLISLYVPDIDRAAGHFNADAQVTGTIGRPVLAGQFKVSDGEIDVYQVNLAIRGLDLEATLSDGGVDFKGAARLGAGNVNADGHVEWRNLLPYGKFHLAGTNLRVADIPEAVIDASPDLDFDIAGRRIQVSGKVLVPYAKIQPKDIASAVRTSDDEIIVGAEPDDPSKRFEVLSAITLTLGDKISIDTLGLKARIGGSIQIRSGYEAFTTATGTLNVVDGKYAAYGRLLDIASGELNFNGPIDNPALKVTAKKEFPDVTAYVNVRGTLQQPRMTFSSVPPLPQSQVVSLILAGGSLESAQNRGGNIALGQGVAMLAQEYGGAVGIQDASLESDINNDTSVVLGRYLNPRLYVSYGVSLTESLNVFKLRYTLGDHWTLKGEAGQAQGADLVYTIAK